MSDSIHILSVDTAALAGSATELWWAAEKVRLKADHGVVGQAVSLHDRAAVLALTARLLAHGVPSTAITVTVRAYYGTGDDPHQTVMDVAP